MAAASLFEFQDPQLTEVSGIGAAQRLDDIVYVHNDSGDAPRVFAVDGGGVTVGEIEFRGARAVDWEDMAVAGGFVYTADIGDNNANRDSVQIYRIPEPDGIDGTNDSARAERMDLRYPDGAHNAEAVLVHPTTGEIGVVTKARDGGALYVVDGFTPGRAELRRAADVDVGTATGAAVAPDGSSLVVRDYTDAYLYEIDGETLASAFDAEPRRIGMPFAIQAEAITYSADGESLLTTHEGPGATVSEVSLVEDDTAAPPDSDDPPAESRERSQSSVPVAIVAGAAGLTLLLATVVVVRRRRM